MGIQNPAILNYRFRKNDELETRLASLDGTRIGAEGHNVHHENKTSPSGQERGRRRMNRVADSLSLINSFDAAIAPHALNSLSEPLAPRKINVFSAGTCNVLVVAPHGFKRDDMNTEILGRLLAQELDACAVINNQKYRKPRAGDPGCRMFAVSDPRQLPHEQKRLRERFMLETSAIPVDLNKWQDADSAAPDYFLPLVGIVEQLCNQCSNPLVLFIHGIADRNRSGRHNPDFVVGAGYELREKRRAFDRGETTAREHVVDEMVVGLTNMDHAGPYWVEEGFPGYAAANPIRMPWVFKILERQGRLCANGAPVDAIQLEVRHTGFRDEPNLPRTAAGMREAITRLSSFVRL
jgi:hypothetical protein